jgi:hypothetical protein
MSACGLVGACAVTTPIQPAATSKSGFDGAVYKGQSVVTGNAAPGAEIYRVFIQGATGFVSMQSVRDDAEQRAGAFCGRKGMAMESLLETTAAPPYILGNFPRIEIVFTCVAKAESMASAEHDSNYQRLVDLKKLLDSKIITQSEFDNEKKKLLSGP